MTAAVVRIYGYNGSGPTGATVDAADSASFKFGRDDVLISAVSVPIPTANPSTHYSYLKYLALDVTTAGTTNLSNRRIAIASSPTMPSGLNVYYQAQATYTQNTGTQGTAAGNYPADTTSALAAPSGYTAVTTTNVVYDSSSVASAAGKNGEYVQLVSGVDNTYAAGGGAATLPSVQVTYDEQ